MSAIHSSYKPRWTYAYLYCSFTVGPWAGYPTSLSLDFPIYDMSIIEVLGVWNEYTYKYHEDELIFVTVSMYLVHGKHCVFDKVIPLRDGEFCSFYKDHYQDSTAMRKMVITKSPMKITSALYKIWIWKFIKKLYKIKKVILGLRGLLRFPDIL